MTVPYCPTLIDMQLFMLCGISLPKLYKFTLTQLYKVPRKDVKQYDRLINDRLINPCSSRVQVSHPPKDTVSTCLTYAVLVHM